MDSNLPTKGRAIFGPLSMGNLPFCLQELEVKHGLNKHYDPSNELSVSFGYHCSITHNNTSSIPSKFEISTEIHDQDSFAMSRSSSFSCLSGAALSANATLANTNICNGFIAEEILPGLDSPKSFRRMTSSPSLLRLDSLSCSTPASISPLSASISTDSDIIERGRSLLKFASAPTSLESSGFLNTMDLQMAGGAAGEDRVQAVCSEENGWLFCGVYDGFNGRDAADYLACTLYEKVALYLHMYQWAVKQQGDLANVSSLRESLSSTSSGRESLLSTPSGSSVKSALLLANNLSNSCFADELNVDTLSELSSESFHLGVLNCLSSGLAEAETEFLQMVEQEMEDRPDLVSVGSSVLAMLLYGEELYVLNLGDSRAVLATCCYNNNNLLQAIQLTETHSVDNKMEHDKVLADHPDDPSPIIWGRVKGKLKLTRAFGVGYLKKRRLNDALMGILRVQNLCSPPYVYTHPSTMSHTISENDLFVVLGSDGLFDFFSNQEIVELVHLFIQEKPYGDPAKHLVQQLVRRAAENAGFSTEELMNIPVGRRRKYHDDVTVIVIILGNKQRMSRASTSL